MRSLLTVVLSSVALTTALSLPVAADVRINVDKSDQRMSVEVNGEPRYSWPVSTGTSGYDTPSGSYRAFRMERDHRSKEWDNAPMPQAIFFTPRGHAIHGTNHTRQLGRPASHGCVRLSPKNAAALFSLVKAQGIANTRVTIEGNGPLLAIRKSGTFKSATRKRQYDVDGLISAGMRPGGDPADNYLEAAPIRRSRLQRRGFDSSYDHNNGYRYFHDGELYGQY